MVVISNPINSKTDEYIEKEQKGSRNGIAELDNSGKVPSNQLPTFVSSINGKSGEADLNAEDVGARPNTWTPSASDVGAIPTSQKGAANGVASLDSSGYVTTNNLASYIYYGTDTPSSSTGKNGDIYIKYTS